MSNLLPPSSSESVSPSGKSKKPWYKKTWFFILVGLIVAGNISDNFFSDKESTESAPTTILASSTTTTSTTTIPEVLWGENLKSDTLATDLAMATCTELKKVIKNQTKLIDTRITATEKPSKDQYESAAYIQEIDWAFNPHVATIHGLKRDATDPVLTSGSMSLPTNTQYDDFVDFAISSCGLLTNSDVLDDSALGLDNRLSSMISSANNLPWYPQGFKEYFPGVAFKKAKKSLDCYSCWGIVYEVITNRSCPSQLYVQANFIDSNGAVFDWSNDTVQSLRAGQMAYVQLVTYGYSGSGTVELTEVNCY